MNEQQYCEIWKGRKRTGNRLFVLFLRVVLPYPCQVRGTPPFITTPLCVGCVTLSLNLCDPSPSFHFFRFYVDLVSFRSIFVCCCFLTPLGLSVRVLFVTIVPSSTYQPDIRLLIFRLLWALCLYPFLVLEPSHSRGAPEVPERLTLGAQYLTRYNT